MSFSFNSEATEFLHVPFIVEQALFRKVNISSSQNREQGLALGQFQTMDKSFHTFSSVGIFRKNVFVVSQMYNGCQILIF